MGSFNSRCQQCKHKYNAEEMKPLVLPCGHSFCKSCILKIPATKKKCFICQVPWACDVKDLPMCYQLLDDKKSSEASAPTDTFSLSKTYLCQQHSKKLDFWCNTCYRELCDECLSSEKQKSCELIVSDGVLDKPESFLPEGVEILQRRTAVHQLDLQKRIYENSDALKHLTKINLTMHLFKETFYSRKHLKSFEDTFHKILECINGYDTSKMTRDQKRTVMRLSTCLADWQNNKFFQPGAIYLEAADSLANSVNAQLERLGKDTVWQKIAAMFYFWSE